MTLKFWLEAAAAVFVGVLAAQLVLAGLRR